MQNIFCSLFMLIGSLLIFLAGVGLIRMPDLYTRISATSKASTLGTDFLLFAVAMKFFDSETVFRALAIIIFIILTTPVSAHVIARVAYLVGIPMWEKSIIDEFDGEFEAGSSIGKKESE